MLFLAGEKPVSSQRISVDSQFSFTEKTFITSVRWICDRKTSTPAVITMQDDLGSFTFITNVLGSQIQISIITSKRQLLPEYYSS
jgi:hypothetical protein